MKLNLGCGTDYKEGWTNVDSGNTKCDVKQNIEEFPWPFEDSSVEEILMKHVMEHISKPNFITHKKITGDSINLSNSFQGNELTNKIILIENADPGYDWIFSKNPLGLIPKYSSEIFSFFFRSMW